MNLIIDAGNTNVKLAVFKGDDLIEVSKIGLKYAVQEIQKILNKYKAIDKVISSAVSNLDENTLQSIFNNKFYISLTHKTHIPFQNLYTTPNTLGADRIALIAGAVSQYPNKNILVVDAGTCITYDFVNSNAQYYGGGISPGLKLRYKSLSDHTANLPLLNPKYLDKIIGDSTENAIHAGVTNGLVAEINGLIEQFSNKYIPIVVILTGGDAIFLSKRLKSGIFVDPNFLLHGLNYILEYNINK